MIEDMMRLAGIQVEIVKKVKENDCLDMTVEQMIRYCVLKKQIPLAERLKGNFRINDKK